jgi:glycerophosphoryl diester phosphodiesterase
MDRTQVWAHRGFSKVAPENTMAAFNLAARAGADGVELDVQMTRDGVLVVIHDERLERTTDGGGWVKDYTWVEVKSLDAGSWFSPAYRGERVPSLREVLEWIRDTDMVVNIELKNSVVRYRGMEEKGVEEVERLGLERRVVFSSFNHESLRQLHLYRPQLELAALYDKPLFEPWNYALHLGVTGLHPHHSLVTEKMVTSCRAYGIRVRTYTVDHSNLMRRFLAVGVDAVITNLPDRLRRLRDG